MPDDEKRPSDVFADVNPSELGQLSPGYTPYNPNLQSWNRGRALGRGGDSYRTQQSSTQPEFTALESEDLSAAAREIAVHLRQFELGSVLRYESEEQAQSTENDPNKPTGYKQQRREQEQSQEIEKEQEQQKGTEHER